MEKIHLENSEKLFIRFCKNLSVVPPSSKPFRWVDALKPLFTELYGWNPDEDNNYGDYLNTLFKKLLSIYFLIKEDNYVQQIQGLFNTTFHKSPAYDADEPIERAIDRLCGMIQGNSVVVDDFIRYDLEIKPLNHKCQFHRAWIGVCNKPADESGYCEEHKPLKCCSCGEQATHECKETMGLVCGAPLCNNCEHTICSNGCNSGGSLPEGLKGHCKKTEQQYLPWFIQDAITDKSVLTIVRKNHEQTVRVMQVKDLDRDKCSNKFLSHSLNPNALVYVKCDENGNLEYRGKKEQYRLYPAEK